MVGTSRSRHLCHGRVWQALLLVLSIAIISTPQQCLAFITQPPRTRSIPLSASCQDLPAIKADHTDEGGALLPISVQVIAEAHAKLKDAFAEVDVRTQARLRKILQVYRKHQVWYKNLSFLLYT